MGEGVTGIVEKVRRIWTPDQEVQELVANLEPQTEVDSIVRDFFCRTVKKVHDAGKGPLTLDITEPNNGNIRWEITQYEGRTFATVWWEPS